MRIPLPTLASEPPCPSIRMLPRKWYSDCLCPLSGLFAPKENISIALDRTDGHTDWWLTDIPGNPLGEFNEHPL